MTNTRIVYTNADGSVSVVIPTGEVSVAELKATVVPVGATNVREITTAELPSDRVFRAAWDDSNPENFVGVNLAKAKLVAHEKRRAKREEEFAPHDEAIAKQFPGKNTTTEEAARQVIRDKYAVVQANIDSAVDEAGIRAELVSIGAI